MVRSVLLIVASSLLMINAAARNTDYNVSKDSLDLKIVN